MKEIRASIAALAAARKINYYSLGDLSIETLTAHIDAELAPAIPLLEALEKELDTACVSCDLTNLHDRHRAETALNNREKELANVRATLHRLKPMNQSIHDND
jgi:hypothetical protein